MQKRWFFEHLILIPVRWYLRLKLSYCDLAHIMGQMGATLSPRTILRCVVRYPTDLAMLAASRATGWGAHSAAMKRVSSRRPLDVPVPRRGVAPQPDTPALRGMGMRNEFNFRLGEPGPDSLLSILEQCGGAGSSTHQITRSSDARIQKFSNAWQF